MRTTKIVIALFVFGGIFAQSGCENSIIHNADGSQSLGPLYCTPEPKRKFTSRHPTQVFDWCSSSGMPNLCPRSCATLTTTHKEGGSCETQTTDPDFVRHCHRAGNRAECEGEQHKYGPQGYNGRDECVWFARSRTVTTANPNAASCLRDQCSQLIRRMADQIINGTYSFTRYMADYGEVIPNECVGTAKVHLNQYYGGVVSGQHYIKQGQIWQNCGTPNGGWALHTACNPQCRGAGYNPNIAGSWYCAIIMNLWEENKGNGRRLAEERLPEHVNMDLRLEDVSQ